MSDMWMPGRFRPPFRDRVDAGRRLATRLESCGLDDPLVVGLPRGGVPVAAVVAHALGAPLDVVVVRKVGLPGHAELAMGAVGEGGVRVVNEEVVRLAAVPAATFDRAAARESDEVDRRVRMLRGGRAGHPLQGRTVVVVDDGIATGSTAEAALRVVRAHGAARVVLAVPVAPPDTVERLGTLADDVVCLEQPEPFGAVGTWYESFDPVSDDEVRRLLAAPRAVRVPVRGATVDADLTVPAQARGLVVFAHGSGSSRASPRNRAVARALSDAGLATLLLDLLTPEEERDRANVFDVELLADRLVAATRWAAGEGSLSALPVGYFGASTGAAAALVAAARLGDEVRAVVSRGGRPDLAGAALPLVRAATLLVVGGADRQVLALNEQARQQLRCSSVLEVVPGATHLFEERGALERVEELARDWFLGHLAAG